MAKAQLARLKQQIDDWRVHQHFNRVETILRAQDVSHLPKPLQLARERCVGWLHDYATRGIFPRNSERPGCNPCFIDRDGRECAVAHLLIRSGHTEIAHNVAAVANYATVPEINLPELDAWGMQVGFSREDLTLIQPGYWFTFSDIQSVVFAAWATGLIAIAINAVQIIRKRKGIVLPVIGLVIAIGPLLAGLYCLYGALDAYGLVAQPDGYPNTLPLHDVGPLLLGFVVSLAIALLAVGLSYYRLDRYLTERKKTMKDLR